MSLFCLRVLGRLPAPGPADPDVGLGHRADGAGLDQLDDAAVVVVGVDLGAHLGGDLGLGGGLADDPGLADVVGQRLLAVDVLAELQGRQGGEGVGVLGGADDDGVEVVGVVEDLAEVAEPVGPSGCVRAACSTAGSYTSQRATMFSDETPSRFDRPAAAGADHRRC